jgi:DNA-binding transcriptional regulator YdaS (Cro superfamily)
VSDICIPISCCCQHFFQGGGKIFRLLFGVDYMQGIMYLIFTMKALNKAIQISGSQSALARKMGIKQGYVGNWLRSGRVPVERCIQIESVTGGAVRCEELRPDIDWAVLRNKPEGQ